MLPVIYFAFEALLCLIALLIYLRYRRNHVDFVTFDSEEDVCAENPVEAGEALQSRISSAVPVENQDDFEEMEAEIMNADSFTDPMAVLFDRRTRLAIVSVSVMREISSGNRVISRKVKRFMEKSGCENVMVMPLCQKVISV